MNRYENGKIYKITDIGYNKCYIGSTTETLSQRMARHKGRYKEYLSGGADNTRSHWLFDEFGVENCKIELVEIYPCNSKEELERQEGKPRKRQQEGQRRWEKTKYIQLEKHLCGCGKYYTYCHKKRHETSQLHQNWLKQQQQAEQEQEETETD